MPNQQPIITSVNRRKFPASATGLLAFIIDSEERVLLLAHPKRKGEWEVINGGLDAEETILDGVMREIGEEAGKEIRVQPLGAMHAYTFRFDDNVQYMISICYVLAYESGEVLPGDDMTGSVVKWWRLDEVMNDEVKLIVPRDQKWLLKRAIEVYQLWKDQKVDLQPERDPQARTKYKL